MLAARVLMWPSHTPARTIFILMASTTWWAVSAARRSKVVPPFCLSRTFLAHHKTMKFVLFEGEREKESSMAGDLSFKVPGVCVFRGKVCFILATGRKLVLQMSQHWGARLLSRKRLWHQKWFLLEVCRRSSQKLGSRIINCCLVFFSE